MPSTLFDDADATFSRGAIKHMKAALTATLNQRDPKQAKANRARSPGHRRNLNYLERMPLLDLLKCAVRRLAKDQERINARERVRRYQQRQRLKRTMAAG